MIHYKREETLALSERTKRDICLALSLLIDNISEFLWAAISAETEFPNMADKFEKMAIEEAIRFRLLGRMMLQNGIDPAIRSLWQRKEHESRKRGKIEHMVLKDFLTDMQVRTEKIQKEVAYLQTKFPKDDALQRILDGEAEQLYGLRRMLS